MMRIYDGSIVSVDGIDFLVHIEPDYVAGPPWNESDGHGPVSDWTKRDKAPGEILLSWKFQHNDSRSKYLYGRYRLYYDFQAAVKIAKRDGWNTAPYVWKTSGEQAAAAAMADFTWLKRWCDDEWFYAVITVHPLDDFGDILPMSASLGRVEYDVYDDTGCSYIADVVEDLAREVIAEHDGMFAKPFLPKAA